MKLNRKEISQLIYNNINNKKDLLKDQFLTTKDKIGYFYVDDLLPKDLAEQIYENFPDITEAVQKKNLREYKFVAYQMDKFNPLLEEVIYAFQEKKILDLIAKITETGGLVADEFLYAGGLSLMKKDNFLNKHLDNSHDKDRNLWRVFNLLYYVTPDWNIENGGNLELWQNGIEEKQTTVESKFNRLVVMATHHKSWHSVSKVKVNKTRNCVSNYYFSERPLLKSDEFHVTTFRGKSSEKIKDTILKMDNFLRFTTRKLFKKGIRKNPHQYKK